MSPAAPTTGDGPSLVTFPTATAPIEAAAAQSSAITGTITERDRRNGRQPCLRRTSTRTLPPVLTLCGQTGRWAGSRNHSQERTLRSDTVERSVSWDSARITWGCPGGCALQGDLQARCIDSPQASHEPSVAEGVGFEPTEPEEGSTVFKTVAFVRSAIPPWSLRRGRSVLSRVLVTGFCVRPKKSASAEGVGFEPTEPVNPIQQFSRLPPSSARPSLRCRPMFPRGAEIVLIDMIEVVSDGPRRSRSGVPAPRAP